MMMSQNAPAPSHTRTLTTTITEDDNNISSSESRPADSTTIRLKKKKKKVVWRQGTVDNEGMGKKTSKCCCIYQKPHKFGESSSDSEEEDCDHCRGHVEKKSAVKPADT